MSDVDENQPCPNCPDCGEPLTKVWRKYFCPSEGKYFTRNLERVNLDNPDAVISQNKPRFKPTSKELHRRS